MIPFFVRNISDPLIDALSGRCTIKRYRELMQTQYFSKLDLIEYQEKKVRALVTHAYSNVPFYRRLFKSEHIHPSDIRTIEDMEKIPIIDKQTLKNAVNYPGDLFAQNLSRKHIKTGTTGGTTGSPLVLAKDVNTRSYGWAAYWRWETWMGLNHGDPTASIWGQPIVDRALSQRMRRRVTDILENEFRLNAFLMSAEEMEKFTKKIVEKKPKHIHGYASSLITYAAYLERNGINLPPMQVSTTAEVLESVHRAKLEDVFHGGVFDQYGCGECGSIAFECDAHEGLHVAAEHVLVECEPDHRGHDGSRLLDAIITDLDNFAMPIIRYKNGDVLEMADHPCSCGRNLPLIKKIGGRVVDSLRSPDGKIVHQDYFTHLLSESGWYARYDVAKYQVIQDRVDHLEWRMVMAQEPSRGDTESIMQTVHADFPGMSIDLKLVDSISNEPSGKYRYIKNTVG